MYFFKAFALLTSFLFSVSQGGDKWAVDCLPPLVRDEGLAVSLSWENSGKVLSHLFDMSFVGSEKLAEYECSPIEEEGGRFRNKVVLMDCYRPQSWDHGYDILLTEDEESGHRTVYVHELNIAGPILRGNLECDGNWGPIDN
ncbi:MAG: hypothetical protein KDD68_15630 [Bdellovibrionales bacterium]|nr:hypothetical protein [Bdellovibrionales bacterium]